MISNNVRPLHESVAKEKWAKILLIETGNEANNGLLASFPTKSSEFLVIFTHHLIRAKVSMYSNLYFWHTSIFLRLVLIVAVIIIKDYFLPFLRSRFMYGNTL